jgi:hypothetical protein
MALKGRWDHGGKFKIDAIQPALPEGDNVAGYVYLIHDPDMLSNEVVDAMLATGKPVAIIDNGVSVLSGDLADKAHPRLRVFNASAHRQSGIDVATYALSRGHHQCAYISPFHADSWSQTRYEGIRGILDKAGGDCSLDLFAATGSLKDHGYANAGTARCQGEVLTSAFLRWRTAAPEDFRIEAEAMRAALSPKIFMLGEIRTTLNRLLDNVATNRNITAWIMANDMVARMALQFVRLGTSGFRSLSRSSGLTMKWRVVCSG